MKLIDLLVQELPNRGGWPKGASYAVQHSHDLGLNWVIFGSGDCNLIHKSSEGCWRPEGGFCFPHGYDFKANILCDDHDTLVNREQYEAALSASKQPEWNGEGLPPVGTRCEWQDKNTKAWLPVVVVYSSEWVTVIKEDKEVDPVELAIENYADEARCKFRPIRTEAERKREDAINEIASLIGRGTFFEDARAIYAAIAKGEINGIKLDGDA